MPYSKMKLAVGIFVVILFIAIAMSLYLLLKEKGTFEKRYSYHFTTESASSFNIGMPLKISGFNIGVIDDISLNDDGTVYMTFSVSKNNKKWLREESVLILKKPLIGSAHIELYSAIGNEPLQAGKTLNIVLSDDINDMISKLEPAVNKMINIINSIDSITSYMDRDDSELMITLKNIEKFTSNLANNKSLLTTITGDKNSTLSLINALNETAKIMKDISKTTSSLDTKIIDPSSSAIKELDAIMRDVKHKLEALDATVKAVGSYDTEILDIKEQISAGLQKSNQIIDKVDALMQDEKKSEVTLP
ncbi:MAG: hypothetical protein AUK54_04720 [Helicobacteraceae bacterium CG2_30_36_10]|nr:MAG: hypothetical protein AUK54_04720 [Helicobacteraceae bacterium CG2_30_36_10]